MRLHSGGYGTNGANGGRGGDVFTTVSEDELDLLLAVGFNVKGGSGGDAGRHGVPGRGGPGGLGGAKFSGYSYVTASALGIFLTQRPDSILGATVKTEQKSIDPAEALGLTALMETRHLRSSAVVSQERMGIQASTL
jgi:hypothetical protein